MSLTTDLNIYIIFVTFLTQTDLTKLRSLIIDREASVLFLSKRAHQYTRFALSNKSFGIFNLRIFKAEVSTTAIISDFLVYENEQSYSPIH